MPNPFMRSVQQNVSDESMTPDRPHPTDPILETYEGSNHPYRGVEQHGIADNADPTDPIREFADGTRKVVFDEPEKEIAPVPVRIVTEGGNELRRAVFSTYSVGNVPARICGRRTRESVTIKNDGPFNVVLSGDANIGLVSGYTLPVGDDVTLRTEDDIWAYAVDTVGTAQSGINRSTTTVSNAVITLVPATASGTSYTVVVRNESATDSVRLGTSGSVPSAANGLLLGPNEQVTLYNVVGALQAIRTAAADVSVSAFRGSVANSSTTAVDSTSVSSVRIIEESAVAV
jgi:hypothetical protein